ncbi:hypothetical protein MJO28_016416 [Puccinia striiformis f. sp. tritici]|uniref:Uncharacterized protein n=1 Tax=Puccinia striiformis f. sp. tritici TaxID=168172 RepID=A0ACC0DN75_9BASI|nr:hypothetical protein MJO28_016416 [Puccinia striiformis f. sp. tritici]
MDTSASLIFANSHNSSSLAEVHSTHLFLRLMKIERSSKNGFERLIFNTHAFSDINLITKLLNRYQLTSTSIPKKENIIELGNVSEGALRRLGYGRLTGKRLIRETQHGVFICSGLYPHHQVIIAQENRDYDKKLIGLASIESKGCDRLLMFKSFRCSIHDSFNKLLDRLNHSTSGLDCRSICPLRLPLMNSNPQSHSHLNHQEIWGTLKILDLRNLASPSSFSLSSMYTSFSSFLCLRSSWHSGLTITRKGINKRTLGRQVEDFLISPIYEWINQTTSHDDGNTDSNRKRISTQNGGPSLDVKSLVHCSIKILRDLCIEIFNQAKAAFQAALYDYNVSEQKRTFTIRVRLTQDRKPTRQSARGTVMNYGSRLGTALNEQSTESVSFNINEPLVP